MGSPPQSEFVLMYELDGVPHERTLIEDRLVIGRAKDCTICFPFNNEVSRLHATLRATPDGWVVEDMSSRSGTFVNGQKIDSARRLNDKDVLTIGQIALTLREKRHETETVTVDGKTPIDVVAEATARAQAPAASSGSPGVEDRKTEAAPAEEPAVGSTESPANFYELIGVPLFEPDLQQIQEAAKSRLSELRAGGTPHSRSQRQAEVDAIAAGLAAMANPEKRRRYDTDLAEQLGIDIEVHGGRVVPVWTEGFGQLLIGIAIVGALIVLVWITLPWLRAALAPLFDVPG